MDDGTVRTVAQRVGRGSGVHCGQSHSPPTPSPYLLSVTVLRPVGTSAAIYCSARAESRCHRRGLCGDGGRLVGVLAADRLAQRIAE